MIDIDPKIIYAILIFIAVGIISFFIYKWVKNYRATKGEKVLVESGINEGEAPKTAPKNKNYKTNTLGGGKSIKIADRIGDCIHTFSKNDIIQILTILKDNVKTRTDMGMVVGQLNLEGYKLYDILAKDLSLDQTKTFSEWLKKLPEYIYF